MSSLPPVANGVPAGFSTPTPDGTRPDCASAQGLPKPGGPSGIDNQDVVDHVPALGARRPPPRTRERRWLPDASTPWGAVLYAAIGGLIVWLLVDVLPHIHIHVSVNWH